MNWPPVFHLQWLGHVPHDRHHLPTTISPMRELIGSEIVFFPLELSPFFCISSFNLLPSKSRSINTLGTRWHDIFITLFRYFIKLFYSFQCLSFPFLKGCRLEQGHIVPVLCSHSYLKKKKKKKKKSPKINFNEILKKFLIDVPYIQRIKMAGTLVDVR